MPGGFAGTQAWIRIDTFDDCEPSLSDEANDTDRPQQSRCVVNQKEKRCKAKDSKARRHKQNKLKNAVLYPVDCADCEQKRKDEKSGRVADDVVSHQYGGDDARSQLSARHMESDKQGTECEDHEAQCCRYQCIEHGVRA